jgi:mercuric transport protein
MHKWLGGLMAVWVGIAFAATPNKVVLDVENMTCPACSITIEKALDKVPGVTGTKIDTKAATVTVTFDAERTTVSAVAVAITEAGFPAKVRTNGG